jgi:hypothetical protein
MGKNERRTDSTTKAENARDRPYNAEIAALGFALKAK